MSDCVYNDSDDDAVQSKESGTRLFELSMSSQQEISIAPSSKDSRFEIGYVSEQVGEYTCTPKSDSPMSSSSIDYKVPVRSGMHTPHKSYTLQYKLSVLDWYHSHGENKKQTAKHFGVDRKRIRDWLRLEQQFRLEPKSNMQRKRNTTGCPPHYQELDKTVLEWYKEQEVLGRKVTNRALRTKALELAPQMGYEDTFKASTNWAVAWRRRNKDVLLETSTLSDNTELATELEEEFQQDGVNSKSNVVETITGITEASNVSDVNLGQGEASHVCAPICDEGSSSQSQPKLQALLDVLGQQSSSKAKKQTLREHEHWIALIQQTVDSMDNEFNTKMSQIKLLLQHLKTSIELSTDACQNAQTSLSRSLPISVNHDSRISSASASGSSTSKSSNIQTR